MPTFTDVGQFLGGQFFGRTFIPQVDLSGQTMIVTGGNTGLGLDCAKHLTKLGLSTLILACRNLKKGQAAKDSIVHETQCNGKTTIEVWEVDLDHYDSVLAFSKRVCAQLPRLDGFVANAGLELKKFELSEDLERSLTVNVVSTFLMALAVLPKLRETAAKYHTTPTISFIGSMVHVFGPTEQLQATDSARDIFEALSNPSTAKMSTRYPLSKLIEHLCFLELVSKLPASHTPNHVTINCVNPGWCKTELSRYGNENLFIKFMALIFRRTSEEGSRTLVHGVTAGSSSHGKYLSECQVKEMSEWVRSDDGTRCRKRIFEELIVRLEMTAPGITHGLW